MWNPDDPILSNAQIYRQLAIEALAKSQADSEAETWRSALSQSLTAIVFAYVATEALLWIVGCTKLGVPTYTAVDSDVLENKLKALGVTDSVLLADAVRFRELRRALVREKARLLGQGRSALSIATEDARHMVDTMQRIERAVGVRYTTAS
jgi:hypothetical protein